MHRCGEVSLLAALALLGVACGGKPGLQAPIQQYDALSRIDFNRWAVRLNLPLYWVADSNHDGRVQPDEVASLLFYPEPGNWVADGHFTPAFDASYASMVSVAQSDSQSDSHADSNAAADGHAVADDKSGEDLRQQLVGQDLDQGRSTLISTRLAADEQDFVSHMQKLANLIDVLYSHQTGAAAMASQVPAQDAASQSLFRRDHGPLCAAPLTENNPQCSAIPGAPPRVVDVYPAALQTDKNFCAALEKRSDAVKLLEPFSVVREQNGKLTAVPYSVAYRDEMVAVANELDATAAALDPATEAALIVYLKAAAGSFTSGNWLPADEAWAAMNATNSKWYVRIGPDEVYWEPCSRKAGFHLTFARINRKSLEWQSKLSPLQDTMEAMVAERAGAPYRARKVSFHLPDFIEIILNAGDDRPPTGATLGQSLPNWGPVADQGRGRTVAMTNLYQDPDSVASRHAQAGSVFDASSMTTYADESEADLINTILHEATHNLGPAAGYKVGGRTAENAFGGPVASMMEELKAQTGALYFVEFLHQHQLLDDSQVQREYAADVAWALGHISQGMYTGTHERQTYGNLAAIQVGMLLDAGALSWDANALSAGGKDQGALILHQDKMAAAINDMMRTVASIKARGDKAAALKLIARYVDSSDVVPHAAIAERYLREPKASFVYAVQ